MLISNLVSFVFVLCSHGRHSSCRDVMRSCTWCFFISLFVPFSLSLLNVANTYISSIILKSMITLNFKKVLTWLGGTFARFATLLFWFFYSTFMLFAGACCFYNKHTHKRKGFSPTSPSSVRAYKPFVSLQGQYKFNSPG